MASSRGSDPQQFLPVRYLLPETVFSITATERTSVVRGEDGTYATTERDVRVAPAIAAEYGARCRTDISAGKLESLSLSITLDDSGLIESIGTETARDVTPIINLVGKLAGAVLSFATLGIQTIEARPAKTLEQKWKDTNPDAAAFAEGLNARIGDLLSQLIDASSATEQITHVGAALQVLQRELAGLDQLRREWIASHVRTGEPEKWRLRTSDLVKVSGHSLPDQLPQSFDLPEASAPLKKEGFLVALADRTPSSAKQSAPAEDLTRTDSLIFRRARPVSIGVYRHTNPNEWTLDRNLVAELDVVDRLSEFDIVSIDGRWLSKRKVDLSFHPDRSIKTYAVGHATLFSSLAESAGNAIKTVSEGVAAIAKVPSAGEQELEKAKLKLDLLQTSTDYAQLSAIQSRSVELAELEQRSKILEYETKLGIAGRP